MTEQMQSEIAELSTLVDELADPREGYALVRERIRAYSADGREIPHELSLLEQRALTDCMCESQGR